MQEGGGRREQERGEKEKTGELAQFLPFLFLRAERSWEAGE